MLEKSSTIQKTAILNNDFNLSDTTAVSANIVDLRQSPNKLVKFLRYVFGVKKHTYVRQQKTGQ